MKGAVAPLTNQVVYYNLNKDTAHSTLQFFELFYEQTVGAGLNARKKVCVQPLN
jgi:hypothetical protein